MKTLLNHLIINLKGIYNFFKKSNFYFKIDMKLLEEKNKKFPDWMKDQIENDFKFWKEKEYSKKNIYQTIENFKRKKILKDVQVIIVKIKNNNISYKNFLPQKFHPRFIRLHFFMKKILQNKKFSDVEFLYSIHDLFENPIWLECLEVPIFCISKKKENKKVILFPHVEWMSKNENLIQNICKAALQIPLEKKINIAYWIGSSTGDENLENNERFKIVKLSKKYPKLIEANFSSLCQLNEKQKDMYLREYFLKNPLSPLEQLKYRYLFAIDGNAFPGAFFWQLFSGSLVLKNKSDYLEWYYFGLKNNIHYKEYSNEYELVEFLKNKQSNEKEIINSANHFAKVNLSNEAIISYIFQLFERIFPSESKSKKSPSEDFF